MKENHSIAKTLKKSRIALGHSQKAFAELLGVPHTTYREWEAGRTIGSPEKLVKIAEVCQLSLHELLTGEKRNMNQRLKDIDDVMDRLRELKTKLMSYF